MKRFIPVVAAALFAGLAQAEVKIDSPWVRGTVPAQKVTGAFMTLTSDAPARLVEASTPVAAVTEIHEMAMDGGVMKMRRLDKGVELPAGKAVELKPGGYHLMLMDLKAQMKDGESVPLTLTVQGADGKKQTLEVKALVKPLAATQPPQGHHHH